MSALGQKQTYAVQEACEWITAPTFGLLPYTAQCSMKNYLQAQKDLLPRRRSPLQRGIKLPRRNALGTVALRNYRR